MSESDPKKRYWLAIFFKNMPQGAEFTPGVLHLTVIPWFVANISPQEVADSFKNNFKDFKSFEIIVAGKTTFGPRKNVAVSLVEHNENLVMLHNKALDWFEQLSGRWAVKNPYVDAEYEPHIRRRPGIQINAGDKIKVGSLTLVEANRKEDNQRLVAAKVDFND